MKQSLLLLAAIALPLLAPLSSAAQEAAGLIANPGMEAGAETPEGWPGANPDKGITYERDEDGSRFLRIHSDGGTAMLYREIAIPEGTEALRLSWRWRVTGLRKGKNSWFDARIMMEYMDGARGKVGGAPGAPNRGSDTDGWEERSIEFLVPENARILKFMPSLLEVAAGTVDFDDVALDPIDPEPLRDAAAKAAEERAAKAAAAIGRRRDAAAKRLADTGNLVAERDRAATLVQDEPGKLVNRWTVIDLPPDAEALTLSWRQKVTGLVRGDKPWFDARWIFKFHDADGKEMSGAPGPSYRQGDTDGWEERSIEFLVPEGAVSFILMPCLFQTKAGTFEFEDVLLVPSDPAGPLAAAKRHAAQEAARYVPPEEPDRSRFPRPLHVEGPKLLDDAGHEVWLQGVCLSGPESIPNDRQVEKSTVVAIDDWHANCVRLPVKDDFWFGRSDYQNDGGEGYRALIDRLVTLAANRGAYVALDLHRFRAPKAEHAEFWRDAAARYANHPAVIFDLFNEPHGISWKTLVEGGWVGEEGDGNDESAFLSEEEKRKNRGFESIGMKGLLAAVRSTGARNPVIVSGVFWTNDLTGWDQGWAMDDPDGDGIIYSWHTYNWHPGWARVLPVAAKHPIFVGECGGDAKPMGFIPLADQEDPNTFCPDLLGFIQKHRLHWTGFSMHTSAAPRLLLDWDYTPTPFWGAYVVRALAGERFEMKRMR